MSELVKRLRKQSGARHPDAMHLEAADRIDALMAALVEARRWIGDGDLGDGLHRDIWTPRYRAAVDMIDAVLKDQS